MICSNCGTENPAGTKFCVECASRLSAVCPSCGHANVPTAKFCGECATPLGGAPAAASPPPSTRPVTVPGASPGTAAPTSGAERRLVSVLFADLVGFTPFAEERDAEDVRDILTRYFDTASEVIERYGGTVEKFIGDAVMAVWGAPVAREDDAERSVRAALELVDAVHTLGPGIQARVGVLTGEAAVTVGATNQGMVAGDLVNTAARLQSVAQPGAVLVGEPTMRAASAAIAFEEAGDQTLKGKQAPVPAWRALRVVAQRGGQGRSDLPEPPFVGRDEELRLLKDLIATTGRDRKPRLVSITGPGGIGKSRLAWELEKYIDGIHENVYWHRGRSPSYGEGIAFWALGEMVRRRAGLAEDDDEATTRERIHASVIEFVATDEDRRWVEPGLLTLLGLEPAPAGGRDVLFAAWRIFFERIAERGTTVLLFEDLQWADTGLLDFIEHLLEWARNAPLLVVTLARPELFDRRADWGSEIRNLSRVALEPLTDEAMRALLDGFVPGLPADAVAAILARADGMPLYAVETVRALVADGKLEREGSAYRPTGEFGILAIPETLRSLIASRLDALEPADRSLVADAAVLGQTFGVAGLAAVSGHEPAELDSRLKTLVRRELFDLEIDPRSPERGQYHFVQSLIREVAYGTLAKRDRRTRHLAAARHFEALGDDELAGLLANHYVAAHEASTAGAEADAVAIQARLALSGAAERAATLGGHDQAVAYLRSAIAITADARERAGLQLRAARSANAAARHTDAEALVREAIASAALAADAVAVGEAEALLGEIHIDAGNPPEAVAALEHAIERFPEDGPREVRAALLANLSRALMRSAEPGRAIVAADLALDLAEHLNLTRLVAETFNNKGSSLGYLGREREARALLQAAVDVARAGGHVAAEIRALSNLGGSIDDVRQAAASYRSAAELALRVGNRSLARWASEGARVSSYVSAGGWDEALAADGAFEESDGEGIGSALDAIRHLAISAYMRVARGDPCDGILDRLTILSGEVSDPFASSAVRFLRSDRALIAGDYARAVDGTLGAADMDIQLSEIYLDLATLPAVLGRDVDRARTVAARLTANRATGAIVDANRLRVDAAVAGLEGRHDDAAAGYRQALARLAEFGREWPRAKAGLEFVLLMGSAHPAAGEAAMHARATFERVGATPYLVWLDAALADSAPMTAVSGNAATVPAAAGIRDRTS
ncbi:MAG: adenylate/guanylate cyclase domain-containing protein [Chloroflexota bacterium]